MYRYKFTCEELDATLAQYDVYPKVFLTGESNEVTVAAFEPQRGFDPALIFHLTVFELSQLSPSRYPGSEPYEEVETKPDPDGCLRFRFPMRREGQYRLNFYYRDSNGELQYIAQFAVYALDHDMAGRYPYCGDLHMHTCRSDGEEDPQVVAARYRGIGYDFMVISDHHRYAPSLELRKALRITENDTSDLTDFLIVPGEEVHLPKNDVHVVNFGGEFSVNSLVIQPNRNGPEFSEPEYRSLHGKCPERITLDEYYAIIEKGAEQVGLELESQRLSVASAKWIHEKIQEADGLCIFAHPFWLCPTMQIGEEFTEFFYKEKPFDAFEVLGGAADTVQNVYQESFYYRMVAEGYDYPVVGSTDSHSSHIDNRPGRIASTIVFAPSNTTKDLVKSIKDKYSVAVDTFTPTARPVGDYRWVKYANFLLEYWFPLHDEAARAEGYFLKQRAGKDPDADRVLLAMKGRIPKMIRKYFAV